MFFVLSGEREKGMRKNIWILLLFVTGLSIFLYPHIAQEVNTKIHQVEAEQFKEWTKELPKQMIDKTMETAKQCNESIFSNEGNFQDPFTAEYQQSRYRDCEAVVIEGDSFATIEIPKLNLEIPIYLGATENELSRGIGQVDGSSLPIGGESTHTVLAGHRGMGTKAMFRNLDRLSENDRFYIHTISGTLQYRVYDVGVILPHETESLRIFEGKDLASLITCHPYRHNSHRLVVYGERVYE